MIPSRALARYAGILFLCGSLPLARAAGQAVDSRRALLLGAGPADRAGLVGHLGWIARPLPKVPASIRADGMVGALRGDRVGAASLAVEVAPRLASVRHRATSQGLFLFAALGPAVTWSGPSRDVGGMLAVGTRVGIGTLTLTAEQRFQQGFSPFLVGLAIDL
ncbi:MAG TPA: hypothetical protein VEA99_13190 [Gemmatimonadaceae bacterium]|nr:hypothetical protein [Gemmatimonadaceae bacterium]